MHCACMYVPQHVDMLNQFKIINKHLELQQDIEIVVKQGCFRPKKGHMSLDVVIKIN